MRFEWDPGKESANRLKHGIPFASVRELFRSGEYLEIYDEAHSADEDRFVAIGIIGSGVVVVVFTEPDDDVVRIVSARKATSREAELFEDYLGGGSNG